MAGLIQMLAELEAHRLEVVLVPLNPRLRNYNEFGCKRVATSVPVKWYRDLCNRHASSRGTRRGRFDTRIKRKNVLRALERLVDGRGYAGKYREEFLRVAEGIKT